MFDAETEEQMEAARQAALLKHVNAQKKNNVVTAEEMERKKKEFEAKAAAMAVNKQPSNPGTSAPSNAELTAKIIAEEKARRAAAKGGGAAPAADNSRQQQEEAARKAAADKAAADKRAADERAAKEKAAREAEQARQQAELRRKEEARLAENKRQEELARAASQARENVIEEPAFTGFGRDDSKEQSRLARHLSGRGMDEESAKAASEKAQQRASEEAEEREARRKEFAARQAADAEREKAEAAEKAKRQAERQEEERRQEAAAAEARREEQLRKEEARLARSQPPAETRPAEPKEYEQMLEANEDAAESVQRREEARMAKLFGGAAVKSEPAPAAVGGPNTLQPKTAALEENPAGGWWIRAGQLEGSPAKGDLSLSLRGVQLNLFYATHKDGHKKTIDYRWDLPRPFDPHDITATYDGTFTILLSAGVSAAPGANHGEVVQFDVAKGSNNEDCDVNIKSIPEGYELSCTPSKYDEHVTLTLESPPGEKQICEFKFVHTVSEETEESIVHRRITVKQNIRVPFTVTTGSFSWVTGAHGLVIKVSRPSIKATNDTSALIPIK